MLATSWRLVAEDPRRARSSGSSAWLLRHPVRGAAAGVVGVAALTGVALLVGPPTS